MTDAAIMLGATRVTKIVSKAYKAAETLEAKSAKSAHDAIADIFDKAADATAFPKVPVEPHPALNSFFDDRSTSRGRRARRRRGSPRSALRRMSSSSRTT